MWYIIDDVYLTDEWTSAQYRNQISFPAWWWPKTKSKTKHRGICSSTLKSYLDKWMVSGSSASRETEWLQGEVSRHPKGDAKSKDNRDLHKSPKRSETVNAHNVSLGYLFTCHVLFAENFVQCIVIIFNPLPSDLFPLPHPLNFVSLPVCIFVTHQKQFILPKHLEIWLFMEGAPLKKMILPLQAAINCKVPLN